MPETREGKPVRICLNLESEDISLHRSSNPGRHLANGSIFNREPPRVNPDKKIACCETIKTSWPRTAVTHYQLCTVVYEYNKTSPKSSWFEIAHFIPSLSGLVIRATVTDNVHKRRLSFNCRHQV